MRSPQKRRARAGKVRATAALSTRAGCLAASVPPYRGSRRSCGPLRTRARVASSRASASGGRWGWTADMAGSWRRAGGGARVAKPDPRAQQPRRSGLLWSVADQAVFSGLSFALAIVIARESSPADFGAFGVAYVVYTVALGAVEALTVEVVAVRGPKGAPEALRRMLGEASGTSMAIGALVAVAGLV